MPSNFHAGAKPDPRRQRFNPSNGFVCLRTTDQHAAGHPVARVSIRRTDLCAFEQLLPCLRNKSASVSIRRTDLCAFELPSRNRPAPMPPGFNPSNGFVCLRTTPAALIASVARLFQSVERICVPSNAFGVFHRLG